MGGFTSVKDILDFAIAREAEAYQFYSFLAGKLQDQAMSEVILQFAEEELRHKANLELEVIKTGRTVKQNDNPIDFNIDDYIVDAGDYMQLDYQKLLLLAIAKEDAAFRLYVALAGMAGDQESQHVLMQIAQEEAKHKILLEMDSYQSTPDRP